MKEKKYNYVYAVINFEQKLAYIGSRGSNTPPNVIVRKKKKSRSIRTATRAFKQPLPKYS